MKFLPNFQRKRVEISIIYECNLKIVKICQKCANFESGLLSEKLLKIVQVAKRVPSRICLGLELNLTETLFFFRLSFTLSVSNIHNPNSTPRLPAPPYLRRRTGRETQSLVSLDVRRFSSKPVKLFSPKRVNLLISLPDFLLLRNDIGRILCWGMLEESRWTCLKS